MKKLTKYVITRKTLIENEKYFKHLIRMSPLRCNILQKPVSYFKPFSRNVSKFNFFEGNQEIMKNPEFSKF